MEGLPVVEDLVAVVDQVGGRAHVAKEPERQEREEPLDAPVVPVAAAAGATPPVLGFLGVPVVRKRRRRRGPSLARRRERHGVGSPAPEDSERAKGRRGGLLGGLEASGSLGFWVQSRQGKHN